MNKYCCPNCGGTVSAWADLDACLRLTVGARGGLSSLSITNSHQSDGRAGVECTKCDWSLHADEAKKSVFEHVIVRTFEWQEGIESLMARRISK